MKKTLKVGAVLVIGTLLATAALAADEAGTSTRPPKNLKLVGDHWTPWDPPAAGPEDYIIQRGDTLYINQRDERVALQRSTAIRYRPRRAKEKGLFDQPTAKAFRRNILERGGTEDPMDLYRRFRGKDPSIEPLLRKRGLL